MLPDPHNPYPLSTYGTPPQPSPPDDTLAWAGIASSVASWLTCCCMPIPFIGMVFGLGGLLLSVVGVVCGILAYRAAGPVGGRTDLPILAIVIGALRLVLTVGAVVAAIVLIGTVGFAEYFQHAGH